MVLFKMFLKHNKTVVIDNITNYLLHHKMKIAVAESCTSGTLSSALTVLSGSSLYFDCGFITYSNQAKSNLLGVNNELIIEYGAVSQPVVHQMVIEVIKQSNADVAIAISGIAGPTGGTNDKPVGTVCFGFYTPQNKVQTNQKLFFGNRAMIIGQSVNFALINLYQLLLESK